MTQLRSMYRYRFICKLTALLVAIALGISPWLAPCMAEGAQRTLASVVKQRGLQVHLYGDGQTTSHCQLVLTNPLTHGSTTKTLKVVCISRKTYKPPVDQKLAGTINLHYQVIPKGSPRSLAIFNKALELDAAGKFEGVPIPAARRAATIGQLAIWQSIGGTQRGSKDAINDQTLEADMLRQANTDPKSLSSQEKRELKSRIDLICDAADLTCKEASTTTAEQPPNIANPETPQTVNGRTGMPADPGHLLPSEISGPPAQPGIPVISHDTPSNQIEIPAGTTFVPDGGNSDEYQEMMTVEDDYCDDPDDGGGPIVERINVDNPTCHCVAGRMVVVIGPFDRDNPGSSYMVPTAAAAGDQPVTPADVQNLKNTLKEDRTIGATIEWVKQLRGNHLHKVAYQADTNGNPSVNYPYILQDGHWVRKRFPGGDMAGITGGATEMFKQCPGEECCYFEEVLVLMHGNQAGRTAILRSLNNLTGGKPIKKLVVWMCNSTLDLKPGQNAFRGLGATMTPKSCPCNCDKDKCVTVDPDCPNNGRCPHGEPTKVIAGFQLDGRSVPLGLDPADSQFPFTSPNAVLREITVSGETMNTATSATAADQQSRPSYDLKKDKDGHIVARTTNRTVSVGRDNLFMCFKVKSDTTLTPAPHETKTEDKAILRPTKPGEAGSPVAYGGPHACEDGSGCHHNEGDAR